MSFLYHNGIVASVLISKNSGKYRIQSSSFDAIWYVMKELDLRLLKLYANDGDLTITFQEPIPLHELFSLMDEHFQHR
jgi:Bardet-Biedl syndrome 9 protein